MKLVLSLAVAVVNATPLNYNQYDENDYSQTTYDQYSPDQNVVQTDYTDYSANVDGKSIFGSLLGGVGTLFGGGFFNRRSQSSSSTWKNTEHHNGAYAQHNSGTNTGIAAGMMINMGMKNDNHGANQVGQIISESGDGNGNTRHENSHNQHNYQENVYGRSMDTINTYYDTYNTPNVVTYDTYTNNY